MSKENGYIEISCCIECPFLDEFSAYDWGDYGCSASAEVSSEMKSHNVQNGVNWKCPLIKKSIVVSFKGSK